MFKTKTVETQYEEIEAVECDKCGKVIESNEDENFFADDAMIHVGYISPSEPNAKVEFVLCEECMEKIIKDEKITAHRTKYDAKKGMYL